VCEIERDLEREDKGRKDIEKVTVNKETHCKIIALYEKQVMLCSHLTNSL
jgi:hypothetical protein